MFPVEISEHFKFFLCNCCKGQKKKKKVSSIKISVGSVFLMEIKAWEKVLT